jgi:hypothetical protein
MKVVGKSTTAIMTIYTSASPQNPHSVPHYLIYVTTPAVVLPKTETKIMIKKKLLIQIVKQITKIEERPIIK